MCSFVLFALAPTYDARIPVAVASATAASTAAGADAASATAGCAFSTVACTVRQS